MTDTNMKATIEKLNSAEEWYKCTIHITSERSVTGYGSTRALSLENAVEQLTTREQKTFNKKS